MRQLLFSARGRLARGGFWKGVLLLLVLCMAGGGGAAMLGMIGPHQVGSDGSIHVEGLAAVPVLLVSFATIVVSIWAGLCLAIKRFHDRDKSGWWVLIQLVPIIGPIWYFVETGFVPGTTGPNRFGPDPRERALAAAAPGIATA